MISKIKHLIYSGTYHNFA